MKFPIQNDVVRQNVELFQTHIEQHPEQIHEDPTKSVSFLAYVNSVTGAIRFAEEIAMQDKKWKRISLRFKKDKNASHCEIVEKENDDSFETADFQPAAYIAVSETVELFNRFARDHSADPNWGKLFDDLSHLDVEK